MPGSSGSASRRYVHRTAQPRPARARAVAAPMPWFAPVTIAVCPVVIVLLWCGGERAAGRAASGEVRAGTLLQFPVEVDVGLLVVEAGEAGDLLAFRQRRAVRPHQVLARAAPRGPPPHTGAPPPWGAG